MTARDGGLDAHEVTVVVGTVMAVRRHAREFRSFERRPKPCSGRAREPPMYVSLTTSTDRFVFAPFPAAAWTWARLREGFPDALGACLMSNHPHLVVPTEDPDRESNASGASSPRSRRTPRAAVCCGSRSRCAS